MQFALKQYQQNTEIMYKEILNKALIELNAGHSPKKIIQKTLFLLTKKMLHAPTIHIKSKIKMNKNDS